MENEKPKVIVCDPIADIGVEMLREHCQVDIRQGLGEDELVAAIPDYEAAIVRSTTRFPARVIDAAKKLKVIGRAGAGLDTIDVDRATARGIAVVNSPNANAVAVAEHTFALMLSLVRHLPRANTGLKENRWEKKTLMGTGLAGKTLGLLGFGKIARQVAIRAQAFGMRVQVNQRRPTPEQNTALGVDTVGLETLFATSDFVSIHIPGLPENQNLIGDALISRMKPTAYIVNTARGAVLDEAALLAALDRGTIAGAALDVFKKEPAIDNPLVAHDKVIASPHIGASTDDAQQSAATAVAEQILDVLVEKQPQNPLGLAVVPLEKVLPHEHIDPRRVEKLIGRLNASTVFTNPPIVVRAGEHYVVLDGATRVASFKKLGHPHIIVQVLKETDKYTLDTWFHVIRKVDVGTLLALLRKIPEISMVKSDLETVQAEMVEHGGLCYLQTVDKTIYHIQPKAGVNHLDALNRLTAAYIDASHVTRTLHRDVDALFAEFPDMTGVVVFPVFTLEQVLQVARTGNIMPAGITRSIIPGRVMRLNADMAHLTSDGDLAEKNAWLYELVMEKLSTDAARYYAEPIYLLDD